MNELIKHLYGYMVLGHRLQSKASLTPLPQLSSSQDVSHPGTTGQAQPCLSSVGYRVMWLWACVHLYNNPKVDIIE